MDKKRILGLLGAIGLFMGVFAPALDVGILHGVNYFDIGNSNALILLGLAVVSFLLAISNNYRGLWFTGIGSAAFLAYNLLPMLMGQASVRLEGLEDNVFTRGLTNALMPVQMRWGCGVLALGAICIVASAAIKAESESPAPLE